MKYIKLKTMDNRKKWENYVEQLPNLFLLDEEIIQYPCTDKDLLPDLYILKEDIETELKK